MPLTVMCLRNILRIPYTDHVTNATVRLQAGSSPQLSQLIQARWLRSLDTWQGWIRHLTSPEHKKSSSEGCPRLGDAHPVVPVIIAWKQISNLLTVVSTQHGNILRIESTGSTSWKPLRSSSGLGRDDDDERNANQCQMLKESTSELSSPMSFHNVVTADRQQSIAKILEFFSYKLTYLHARLYYIL